MDFRFRLFSPRLATVLLVLLCRAAPLRAEYEDNFESRYETSAEDATAFVRKEAERLPNSAFKEVLEGPLSVWNSRCTLSVTNAYGRGENRGFRYLALRLMVINRGATTQTFKRQKIRLQADEIQLGLGDYPERTPLRYPDSRQRITMNIPQEVVVPAGKAVTFWGLFAPLPPDSLQPALKLELESTTGEKQSVDLAALQAARLGLVVEKLGPRNSLPVFRIHGELNSINAREIVGQVRSLVDQGQERVMVLFEERSAPLERDLKQWLLKAGTAVDDNNVEMERQPSLPKLRRITLVRIPSDPDGDDDNDFEGQNIFSSPDEAATALLEPVLRQLSPTDLLQELRTGHPWSRTAVLEVCGDRLGSGAWPLLAEMSRSADARTRRLALTGLAHQENPQARAILDVALRGEDAEMAEAALHAVLSREDAVSRQQVQSALAAGQIKVPTQRVLQMFAEFYHPDWNGPLIQGLRDPNIEARATAFEVLRIVGHPKLGDYCLLGLQDSDETVRAAAFEALTTCRQPQYQSAAVEHALLRLKDGKTTSRELTLLQEFKVTRAAPLLMHLIDTGHAERDELLQIFGSLADLEQLRWLASRLLSFEPDEQATVLSFMARLPVPEQMDIARKAIKEKPGPLKSGALEILQRAANPEAVSLVAGLLQSADADEMEMACNTLAQIGSTEAINHLKKFRDQVLRENRRDAFRPLETALNLWRDSQPGFSYIRQGHYVASQQGEEQALKYYTLAIEMNPELAMAHSARGNLYLKQQKFDKAREDFANAVKLDSFDSQGLTGVGLLQAIEGQWQQGLDVVLAKKNYFGEDATYSYNTACVVGRALEYLEKQPDSPEKSKQVADLRERAIRLLDEALNQRDPFIDFKWMQEDPDLKPLQGLPEFLKLVPEEHRLKQ